MRILPLEPCVKFPLGHDPCEGCAEMGGWTPCELCPWHRKWSSRGGSIRVRGVRKLAGGRYVNPAFILGRRWLSLEGTIRAKGVPKWAVGRSAIPPHSFPFLCSSSLHPLRQGLISSFFPPLSSFLPHPACLGVPLFSLPLFAKGPMAPATHIPASPPWVRRP